MHSLPRYGNTRCREAIWARCKRIAGKDAAIWRFDVSGNIVNRNDVSGEFGWHVDHIIPRSKGGDDCFDNLQCLSSHVNMSHSNKLGSNKPGYNPREHFNQLLVKHARGLGVEFEPRQHSRLRQGLVINARTSPSVETFRQATIISWSKTMDMVEFVWNDAKYSEIVVYDDLLFEIIALD